MATGLKPYGGLVLFYLAAAVSDFYIPWKELVSGTSMIVLLMERRLGMQFH